MIVELTAAAMLVAAAQSEAATLWSDCLDREASKLAGYPEPLGDLADALAAACWAEESAYLAELQGDLINFSPIELFEVRREFRENARRKAILSLVRARYRKKSGSP